MRTDTRSRNPVIVAAEADEQSEESRRGGALRGRSQRSRRSEGGGQGEDARERRAPD